MKSNEEWMTAYQQGNREAFGILYERMYEALYSFLFRYTREEQLSMDIVHDTFEVLQKTHSNFDSSKGTVKSYIFQISYRLLLNKLNRRKKWRTLLPFLIPVNTASFSAEEKLTIQQAIAILPEKQRAVILLAYYHDLPQEEIAQVLSIPVGTVKSRMHAAMKSLKEQLKGDYHAEG